MLVPLVLIGLFFLVPTAWLRYEIRRPAVVHNHDEGNPCTTWCRQTTYRK